MSASGKTILQALVPEDAIPLGVISIYSFIDSDGDTCYGTHFDGEVSKLEAIGFLEVMKAQLTEMSVSTIGFRGEEDEQ